MASGRAIATVAASMGDGLLIPGVITIPLRAHGLVDLAAAWSALRPDGGDAGVPDVV